MHITHTAKDGIAPTVQTITCQPADDQRTEYQQDDISRSCCFFLFKRFRMTFTQPTQGESFSIS